MQLGRQGKRNRNIGGVGKEVPRLFRDLGWDKFGPQEVEIIRNSRYSGVLFLSSTFTAVKIKINAIKGKNFFSRKFVKCYGSQEYNFLMKARKASIILVEE